MALDFNGSSDYGVIESSLGLEALPVTFMLRFSVDTLTTAYGMVVLGMSATNGYHGLLFRGDNAGDPLECQSNNPGVGAAAATRTGVVSSAWHAGYGSVAAANSRTCVLMSVGAGDSTSTTSITPAGTWNRVWIGRLQAGTYHDGRLAEVAGWNVALTARERDSYLRGYPANRIRPASLKFYKPMILSFQDRITRTTMTTSGTSGARHPNRIGFN